MLTSWPSQKKSSNFSLAKYPVEEGNGKEEKESEEKARDEGEG
jgi:hypothetical protein